LESSAPIIALLSAVVYGAGDFLGGLISRRAPTLAVVFVSQVAGAVALVALLPLLPPAVVTRPDLIWGALAGLAGGTGVALLYRGLAIGTMSVVAPTTAVCAVAIPVAGAIVLGERPTPMVLAGIGIALIAIVLVSQSAAPPAASATPAPSPSHGRLALLLAIASGVAIGIFFLALARTSSGSGIWPLLAARGASAVFFAGMAFIAGHGSLRMPRAVLPLAIACGLLDMAANGLYLVATRGGALSVIVTLASLYPASTVVLARVVLHERLSWMQIAGVLTCLVAIALIVSG
jgi:drug/metabolite transporter (DMT)-like permease